MSVEPHPILLDTDVLSSILRQDPHTVTLARAYLDHHHRLTFSVITRYELLRGLLAKGAARQQAAFEQFCDACDLIPLTDKVIEQAASIYADLHQRGLLIGDADILIAATALTHGYVLSSNNERHFSRIPGLSIENWLR